MVKDAFLFAATDGDTSIRLMTGLDSVSVSRNVVDELSNGGCLDREIIEDGEFALFTVSEEGRSWFRSSR